MSEPQRIENQEMTEVSSLFLPLAGRQLLLPAVTVAEMVPYRAPERDPELADWYMGDIFWREHRLPLVSFEVMCGEPMPSFDSGCRIAILNNVGVDDRLSFLGLATQGIPRLARVRSEELREVENAEAKRFELLHVTHAGKALVIPDVAALEQAFLDSQTSHS